MCSTCRDLSLDSHQHRGGKASSVADINVHLWSASTFIICTFDRSGSDHCPNIAKALLQLWPHSYNQYRQLKGCCWFLYPFKSRLFFPKDPSIRGSTSACLFSANYNLQQCSSTTFLRIPCNLCGTAGVWFCLQQHVNCCGEAI